MKELLIAANTPYGFVSHFDKYLDQDRVICLKGGSGVGKSTLLREVIKRGEARGYNIIAMPCSSDYSSLDMVIVKELGVVILDATAPHIVEPYAYGVVGEIFNLGDFIDKKGLRTHKTELLSLIQDKSLMYDCLYNYMISSRRHMANVDSFYATYLADGIEKMAEEIITDHLEKAIGAVDVHERFGGYLDTAGIVDNMAKYVGDRVVIKIDSPSLTLARGVIEKISQYLRVKQIAYEPYHSIMSPLSLESIGLKNMLITTANINADWSYQLGNRQGVDSIRNRLVQIIDDRTCANSELMRAGECLGRARAIHGQIESIYIEHMDFNALERAKLQLMDTIFS